MKFGLTVRIVLFFMLLFTLLLVMVGTLAYRSGSASLRNAAISEMLVKTIEKEAAINIWMDERSADIRQLSAQPGLAEAAASLMASHTSIQERSAHATLLRYLRPYLNDIRFAYLELFIIDPVSGKVVASTSPSEEGKSKFGHPYFERGKNDFYLQPVYQSSDLKTPAMTAATPLRTADGRVVAVLAARLDLTIMNAIVQRRTGLRQTEDSFLVNAGQYPVTQPRFMREAAVLVRRIDTEAVRRLAERYSGVTLATDYRGVPTIAVYRWNANYQFGLIAKIDLAEALAPAQAFGKTLLLIGTFALLFTSGLAFLLAKTITAPLLKLKDGVRRLSEASTNIPLVESSKDEIGLLAREFNQMSTRIVERTTDLMNTNYFLQAEINKRKQLEQQAMLAANAFASIAESILITDASKKIIYANAAFVAASGYEIEEVMGRTPDFLHSGRQDAAFYAAMWQEIVSTGHWRGEVWNRHKNGSVYPVLLSINVVRDADGVITHYVGVESDITNAKRNESQLEYLAQHDILTGLPNRALFGSLVEAALTRARRTGNRLEVFFIDLDRFKIVNDTLGHAVGDELLQIVSDRINRCIRATDTAARFGGDEFAILLDLLESDSTGNMVAQKILDALAAVFVINGHELYISGSIGISTFPDDGNDVETLLKHADAAMYEVKGSGRNAFRFYSSSKQRA